MLYETRTIFMLLNSNIKYNIKDKSGGFIYLYNEIKFTRDSC